MTILPADPEKRKHVLLGVMVLGLAMYAAVEMLHRPRAAEVAALESRLETLQVQNTAASGLLQGAGVTDVERQLALYREHLVAVEGLVPLSEELPDLLDAIALEAQRTGIELTLLQPTGATEEQFYTRRTYDLAVVGGYHDIGYFLARIGSFPRIITPLGLNLTFKGDEERTGAPRLEARFSIETYVISVTSPTLVEGIAHAH
jgi:Tfp pilus assembly protein PilO